METKWYLKNIKSKKDWKAITKDPFISDLEKREMYEKHIIEYNYMQLKIMYNNIKSGKNKPEDYGMYKIPRKDALRMIRSEIEESEKHL